MLQKIICKQRIHFSDISFAFEFNDDGTATHIFVFLFAMQNPQATVFLKCYFEGSFSYCDLPEYHARDLEFVIGTQELEEQESLVMQHVSWSGLVATPFGERIDAHSFLCNFSETPSTTSGGGAKRQRVTHDLFD